MGQVNLEIFEDCFKAIGEFSHQITMPFNLILFDDNQDIEEWTKEANENRRINGLAEINYLLRIDSEYIKCDYTADSINMFIDNKLFHQETEVVGVILTQCVAKIMEYIATLE